LEPRDFQSFGVDPRREGTCWSQFCREKMIGCNRLEPSVCPHRLVRLFVIGWNLMLGQSRSTGCNNCGCGIVVLSWYHAGRWARPCPDHRNLEKKKCLHQQISRISLSLQEKHLPQGYMSNFHS
jgi:hypothetical protein